MSILRVGIGGAVGSGKTALIERMIPKLIAAGYSPGIVANDIFTQEDALILRRALDGILDPERIVGVETGSCPHSAVREDPTANLEAIDDAHRALPGHRSRARRERRRQPDAHLQPAPRRPLASTSWTRPPATRCRGSRAPA